MRRWLVQDAKARFSELLRAAEDDGPQMVTSRGREAAVVLSMAEWTRLSEPQAKPEHDPLLAEHPRGDFDWPERGWLRLRMTADG